MEDDQVQPPQDIDDGSTPVPDLPEIPDPARRPVQETSESDPVEAALAEAGVEIQDPDSPPESAPNKQDQSGSTPSAVEAALSEAGIPIEEADTEQFDEFVGAVSGGIKDARFGDLFPDESKPVEVRDFDNLLDEVRGLRADLKIVLNELMNK